MNTFIIPIGDWSDDGHGKYDQYTVKTRLTLQEMAEAYKVIDDKVKISEIASEYEHNTISKEQLDLLSTIGIINWKWLGYLNKIAYENDIANLTPDDPEIYIDDSKSLARLIIQAINLVHTDSIKLATAKTPSQFNNWTVNIPGSLHLPGYGLFD